MNKPFQMLVVGLIASNVAMTQEVASFDVLTKYQESSIQVPASINLDKLTFKPDSALYLVEISNGKETPIPYQVSTGEQRTLHWIMVNGDQKNYHYRLVNKPSAAFDQIETRKNDSTLTVHVGGHDLLSYFYATKYPPVGQDSNYKRSGFIHPLLSPHGQELTRIQAPDHYHHYGIWNPWTHVYFEKDTVDFWNIRGRQGTVRFSKLISSTNGQVFSEIKALLEHVVFKKDGTEKVALNEEQKIRVYKPEKGANYYIADFTSKLNCASESPFLILAYRYAGLGWRTTGYWNKDNCEVLTSEGNNRDNTDGSKARWCIVQGDLPGNDFGGAAFLSYPANYNHPEPMRIWTKDSNGRGDMFFNFAPTKDKDWLLEPGKTYTLKYRLIVFNGKMNAASIESAWQYFASPPAVGSVTNDSQINFK